MRAASKEPKDDKWNGKYQEPAAPDATALPELPEGWKWATVEQVNIRIQYGTSAKTSSGSGGIPVIRMGNIVDGELVLDDAKFLPQSHNEFPELLLENGDVLFNRTNSAELETV